MYCNNQESLVLGKYLCKEIEVKYAGDPTKLPAGLTMDNVFGRYVYTGTKWHGAPMYARHTKTTFSKIYNDGKKWQGMVGLRL